MGNERHKSGRSLRARFLERFSGNFSLRLHMTAILLLTALSGLVLSKILLVLGLETMALRLPLVALLAYGVFFLLVYLWLSIIRTNGGGADLDDLATEAGADLLEALLRFGRGKSTPSYKGGGGGFSGGGASADFSGGKTDAARIAVLPHDLGSSGSSADFEMPSLDLGDGEEAVPLALFLLALAVAASVLIIAIWAVWTAPVILGEVAFEAALAGEAFRRLRRLPKEDARGWGSALLSATWVPFALTLLLFFGLGIAASVYAPEAGTVFEILREIPK